MLCSTSTQSFLQWCDTMTACSRNVYQTPTISTRLVDITFLLPREPVRTCIRQYRTSPTPLVGQRAFTQAMLSQNLMGDRSQRTMLHPSSIMARPMRELLLQVQVIPLLNNGTIATTSILHNLRHHLSNSREQGAGKPMTPHLHLHRQTQVTQHQTSEMILIISIHLNLIHNSLRELQATRAPILLLVRTPLRPLHMHPKPHNNYLNRWVLRLNQS